VSGIGIGDEEERRGGSGFLGGARGTPWRADEKPLSGGHEEWEDSRDNALGLSEAEEKRKELK
jgi:hypothetical protein